MGRDSDAHPLPHPIETAPTSQADSAATAKTLLADTYDPEPQHHAMTGIATNQSATGWRPATNNRDNVTNRLLADSDTLQLVPFQPFTITAPLEFVPTTGAEAGGVKQGHFGDCPFEAALASILQCQQSSTAANEFVNSIVKENPDHSYTVSFPVDRSHPVHVTSSEMSKYKLADPNPLVRAMEAAFLKYDRVTKEGNDRRRPCMERGRI